jgi:glycosyltransferase involved in cell wall biosynthesis
LTEQPLETLTGLCESMKLFIFAHKLDVGGSQVNAIDLAVALRDWHGHEVVMFATPGPLVKLVEERGIRYLEAPEADSHPSLTMVRALRRAVRQERPDLLHVWDHWQYRDAFYVEHLFGRIPMVVSDTLSEAIRRDLPKRVPITFGTPEFVDMAIAAGREPVELLVPPVDVNLNKPGAVDPAEFRKAHALRSDEIVLVTVSRLASHLKGESLRRSIETISALGRELPLRLLIVGDGDARSSLQRLADKTNASLGRAAVVLTGEMVDPRAAYAAANIVIGMGGSALRGMAFEKPVIIVGGAGFSLPLTPETADAFYYKGIYGIGDGDPENRVLTSKVRLLAENPQRLPTLGTFSREFVLRHFSLEVVSARLSKFMFEAKASPFRLHAAIYDGLRTAAFLQAGRFVPEIARRVLKSHERKKLKALKIVRGSAI